jgi:serine/threonine-protein kinase
MTVLAMSTPSGQSNPAAKAEGVPESAEGAQAKRERPSARPGGPQSLVGAVLGGRYLIERLIGEGGMGAVYQAEHMHMHKRMAVKVLHPEMGRLPEVVARFEREAMAAAHIEHPNVAAATDFGKLDDGSFFLVLEYVEGESLRDASASGPLALDRALHITLQMASALSRAHSIGIVHRDLKPENVMLVTRDGRGDFVKVLDFGIAKVPIGELGGDARVPGQALTQLGMVYGTPEYMAPEQALGQSVDGRADLYSLGVLLFEMVTGTRPYQHDSKVALLGMHVTAPIPRMQQRVPDVEIPPRLEDIVHRLLAKEASARFSDAKQLIDALDSCARDLPGGATELPSSRRGRATTQGKAPAASAEGGAALAQALGPTRLALGPAVQSVAERLSHWGTVLERAVRFLPSWKTQVTPRRLAIGAAAGATSIVLLSLALSGAGRSSRTGSVEGAVPSLGSTLLHIVRDGRTDEIVAKARADLEKEDFAAALEPLSVVEKTSSDRPDIHLLLERTYVGLKNWRDAMHEAGMLLVLDASAAADPKLREDVRAAALQREAQDEAFSVLETKMGPQGIDILYDVAYGAAGRSYPQAAARARRSLSVEEVRDRASPALGVLLDFREAKTCDAKRALLTRVRDQGDARMLPTLQQHQVARGCGFLSLIDCYPCLHRDTQLGDAMSAIEQRAAASP